MNNELEKAKEIAEENGRDWDDMGNYERESYMDAAREAIENYDPTPWCLYCGSKQNCDCVIAEND